MSSKTFPTLSLEQAEFDLGARFVIGIDEVGRGALFGPVTVGVAVLEVDKHGGAVAGSENAWPSALADSKLMSEKAREATFTPVGEWVSAWAVGSASNEEIDRLGITPCLALAARRAIQDLHTEIRAKIAAAPGSALAILDGSHNWLGDTLGPVAVKVQTKADRDCVSVAAASVLAKVTRDRAMVDLSRQKPALEAYGIAGNKGYSSQQHIDALRELGPTVLHRKTWLTRILAEDALF